MDRGDAVVNLSGASLSRLPWTAGYKRQILASRLEATHTLADAMRMAANAARGVRRAGRRSASTATGPGRSSPRSAIKGTGFLSDVVEAWEAAAHLAPEKTRVVHGAHRRGHRPRRRDEAAPPARDGSGLAGPIGGGGQHWPWMSLHDEAAAIVHLLTSDADRAR